MKKSKPSVPAAAMKSMLKRTARQSRENARVVTPPPKPEQRPSDMDLLHAAAKLALVLKKVRLANEARENSPTNSPINLRGAAGPAGTYPQRRAK